MLAKIEDSPSNTNVQNDQPTPGQDDTFSPKRVASSIGVSESSLKRWCDAGFLSAFKTAGGHRRISRSEVIAFVKRKKIKLLNPEHIGLPILDGVAVRDSNDAVNQFYDSLVTPDAGKCIQLLAFLFIDGWEVAEIFDQIVSPAFKRIGDGWSEGRVEVFQERQACQVCLQAIGQLNSILPPTEPTAPSAMGGSIENDHYDIPTQAVEITMASLGWRATSLGRNLPLESLLKAAATHVPDLFWISVSHLEDPQRAIVALNEFSNALPTKTTLVIGGNAIDANFRSLIKNAICCDNFSQLAALVRKLQPSVEAQHPTDAQTNI